MSDDQTVGGPDEDELAEELPSTEQMLAGFLSMMLQMGAMRLGAGGAEHVSLQQAQVAIDSVRLLEPIAERCLRPEAMQELRGTVSSLQMRFAELARLMEQHAPGSPPVAPEPSPQRIATPPRPKIWTPGGER